MKRELYIDFMKGLAMLAVLVDHTVYHGGIFAGFEGYSVFSVSLFVLVLGYNLYFSYTRNPDTSINALWKKISKFLLYYAIATAIISSLQMKQLNLLTYIDFLVYFKGNAAYYFCFMYIQLVLISGLIYNIVKSSKNVITDLFLLLVVSGISIILTKNTYMLPLHGGGKVLFGGTYLAVLTLGFISAKWYKVYFTGRMRFCILTISTILFFISLKYIPLAWSNPPNLYAIFYTASIFFIIVSLNSLISGRINLFPVKFMGLKDKVSVLLLPAFLIGIIGRYSLHIFLWQGLLIQQLLPIMGRYDFSRISFIIIVAFLGVFIGKLSEILLVLFKKHLLKYFAGA